MLARHSPIDLPHGHADGSRGNSVGHDDQFARTLFLAGRHIEMSTDAANERPYAHAAVVMRPAIRNVEFSQFFELAIELVRFDHIAS